MPNPHSDRRGPALALRTVQRAILFGVFVALSSPAIAQPTTAPVTLNNEVLFEIRAPFHAYSAADRAAGINSRLERVAKDSSIPLSAITVIDSDVSSDILAGTEPLHSVLDAEAQVEGQTRQQLARARAAAIGAAIERYRRERHPARLALDSAIAVGSILAFILLVRISNRLHPLLADRLARAGKVTPLSHLEEEVGRASVASANFLRFVVLATGLYFCLQIALGALPWSRPYAVGLLELVLNPLRTLGAGLLRHLPGLAFVAVVLVLTRYVLKVLKYLFRQLRSGAIVVNGFYPEWATPTYKIVRVLVVSFAAVVAYPYVPGSDSLAFKGVSLFLGVLVSVGSSGSVGNAFAGLAMTYMRAFHVGDFVRIGEVSGEVVETSLLATRLRTHKNVDVTIPNALVLTGPVTNFSAHARGPGLILHTSVNIGYGVPWRQVHMLLTLAAARTAGLLEAPRSFVRQVTLDDFNVVYELNVYSDAPARMSQLYSELHQNIQDTFNEYGVQILSPHYENDPHAPVLVPKHRWYEAPAAPEANADVDTTERVGRAGPAERAETA
jgi:small-conductance mechanosensitive channel